MPAPKPAFHLSLAGARAAFLAAQGLPARAGAPLVPTIERTGFVRTLGGVDVYLAVRARVPGLRRGDLDAAAARGEVQVVPAVRGCIYLVAHSHAALALRVADLLSRSRFERERIKAGIRPGELEDVGQAVIEALGNGPLTTAALRKRLPDGTVRSLGDAGKKVGLSSTLPPALRVLELAGQIERTLEGGRLDTERYLWRLPRSNPFDSAALAEDPSELYARLAEIFFRAAGVAGLKDFTAWAGISQRDAKAAMQRVPLVPVSVDGMSEPGFVLEALRAQVENAAGATAAGAAGAAHMLPFEDNLVALHGGPALLVDPAHHATEVPTWGKSRSKTLGGARHVFMRSVVAEGRMVGFWEYDLDTGAVIFACFDRIAAATRKRLDALAAELSRFLTEDMGHGRSFPMDTDDSLRKRAAFVRGLAAPGAAKRRAKA